MHITAKQRTFEKYSYVIEKINPELVQLKPKHPIEINENFMR